MPVVPWRTPGERRSEPGRLAVQASARTVPLMTSMLMPC